MDYIAALLTVGLGAAGVADVLYLNLRERAAELALLRATGWSPRQLATLIAGEGAFLGSTGSILGALAGLAIGWTLTGPPTTHTLTAAVLSMLGGTAISIAAGTIPPR